MVKNIVLAVLLTTTLGAGAVVLCRATSKPEGDGDSCCSGAPSETSAGAPAPRPPTKCCAADWDAAERADKTVPKNERGFDPVCRRLIDRRAAVAHRLANGVEYHFCGAACAATFDKTPRDYFYCPVFKGSRVDPKISADVDGTTYFFCCIGCRARFLGGARGGDANDFFGMRLALDAEGKALRADHVTPGSAADRAGFDAGTILVGLNDETTLAPERFLDALKSIEPGQTVVLKGARRAVRRRRSPSRSSSRPPMARRSRRSSPSTRPRSRV